MKLKKFKKVKANYQYFRLFNDNDFFLSLKNFIGKYMSTDLKS